MPFMDFETAFVQTQNNFAATPNSQWGLTLTGTTTSATGKGAWTQLIASTTFETNILVVGWTGTATAAAATTSMTMDIGVGASGVENVLIPDLVVGWTGTFNAAGGGKQIILPIYIPKGSRLSARARTSIADDTVDVAVCCMQGPSGLASPVFNRCDAYGISSGGPSGTNVTSGNTGAEGSWTNVGGTTTRNYGAVLLIAQGTNTSAMSALAYHFEVGIGGVTLTENWLWTASNEATSDLMGGAFPLAHNIPASTQLQVRGECSGTAQVIDVALYCFY